MSNIVDEINYWNSRYATGGNSGDGSYGKQLEKKLAWLGGLDIKSITEIGCGDFNFGSNLLKLYPTATYVGSDISSVIVEKNKKDYPQHSFRMATEPMPISDLLLCIDVLFHVTDDEDYEFLLQGLERGWSKYLAVTAYEREQETAGHLKVRKFDYKRFGVPLIREIVEEDGEMYFYLFKRPSYDITRSSACLITKEKTYPEAILREVTKYPFGEILILTHCDSPYKKYELFQKAKYETLYYQDDDAICPIQQVFDLSKIGMINVAMKSGHFEQYKHKRMTMGFGWGSVFPKYVLKELTRYTEKYGEDELFKRDTEKILTQLVFPQNRLILPITDLPSAMAEDRLWRQPNHYTNMDLIDERCSTI